MTTYRDSLSHGPFPKCHETIYYQPIPEPSWPSTALAWALAPHSKPIRCLLGSSTSHGGLGGCSMSLLSSGGLPGTGRFIQRFGLSSSGF
jgi:hypothetical protein